MKRKRKKRVAARGKNLSKIGMTPVPGERNAPVELFRLSQITAVGCLLSSAYACATAAAEMAFGTHESFVVATRTTVSLPTWIDALSVATCVSVSVLGAHASKKLLFLQLASASASALLFLLANRSEQVAATRSIVLALVSAASIAATPHFDTSSSALPTIEEQASLLQPAPASNVSDPPQTVAPAAPPTVNSKSAIAFWCSSATLALSTILSLLVCIGSLIHYSDSQLYPPPGRLISLYDGAISIHLHCIGDSGSKGAFVPTIVLETGMAVPASVSWAKMIPGLEGIGGRVCWYDRAGYGWSDSGPMPQTSKRNAEVLHEVLKVAEEKGPFVLVGHSYGAYTIRLFEHAYPEQVAGLVFLEPSHEDLPFRSAALNPGKNEAAWRAEFNNLSVMFGAISAFLSPFAVADRLGLAAIEAEHGGINKVRYTPRDIASVFNGKYFKAVSSELRTFMYESANQTRQTVPARPRARLPVAVLLGANEIAPFCIPHDPRDAFNCTRVSGADPDVAVAQAHWELQGDFVRRVSDEARFLVAMEAGHYVTVDAPGRCVEAVEEVVRLVQRYMRGEDAGTRRQDAFEKWAEEFVSEEGADGGEVDGYFQDE